MTSVVASRAEAPGATPPPECVVGRPGQTAVFIATGAEQCYRVPPGVTSVNVVAVGARPLLDGEPDPRSGLPATVTADALVSPGQTLYVEVDIDREQFSEERARSEENVSDGRYGGGASDVRTCSRPCELTGRPATDPRLVVAGGGGAGGGQLSCLRAGPSPAATGVDPGTGGSSGRDGMDGVDGGSPDAGGGMRGTQDGGGTGGLDSDGRSVGSDGRAGVGGRGSVGGGGGSGWFGGGSGAPGSCSRGGGGGGGSSFGTPGATFATVPSGRPQVRIFAKAPVLTGSTELYDNTPSSGSINAPPSVSISRPADGGRYRQNSGVRVRYSCSDPDGAFDLLTCVGTRPMDARVDTSTPGMHTFTVDTRDRARQRASKTVRYTVVSAAVDPSPASGPGPAPSLGVPPALQSPATAPPLAIPPAVGQPRAPVSTPSVPQRGDPPPSLGASSEPEARPHAVAAFSPDSPALIVLMVAAFTLLRFAVGGGFALRGMVGVLDGGRAFAGLRVVGAARAASKRLPPSRSGYEGSEVEQLEDRHRGVRWGDRSRTWRWPATSRLDALSVLAPPGLVKRSVMMARVTADAVYARSMLGAASVVWPLVGLVLGVLAAVDAGGEALPPATWLTIAIAMLGVIDATAGVAAVATFALGALGGGGLDTVSAWRTLLGLCSLWFVVPILAGAARPLRRLPASNRREAWDRAADLVIASLVGAWAVQQIVSALPSLAGKDLPIAAHADAAALWVLLALAIRITAETLAAQLYPRRLRAVQPRDLPQPGRFQRLMAAAGRTAVFAFVAEVVVGTTWQLWTGAALFLIPELLSVYDDRLPKLAWLARVRPRGLVEVVFVLLVTTAIGALMLSADYDTKRIVPDGFVFLSLPGFVLSMLALFAPDEDRPLGWPHRIAGVPLLAIVVAIVLGGIPGCGKDLCAPAVNSKASGALPPFAVRGYGEARPTPSAEWREVDGPHVLYPCAGGCVAL